MKKMIKIKILLQNKTKRNKTKQKKTKQKQNNTKTKTLQEFQT